MYLKRFALIACASAVIVAASGWVAPEPVDVSWHPDSPVRGSLFLVRVMPPTAAPVAELRAEVAGEPLYFTARTGSSGVLVYEALAPAPIDTDGDLSFPLEVAYADGSAETTSVDIPLVRGEYRIERLRVAPVFGSPPDAATRARMERDRAKAREVSRQAHRMPRLWTGDLVRPRDTPVTSRFGDGREFNGRIQSRHMGTDLRGLTGEPVKAAARGIVALVDSFHLAGNVVYLNHGGGLVSAYFHLSEATVEQGDVIQPGQVIGRVGATGRVTGAHLHWVVRYGSVSVNPLSLLELGVR